MTTLTATEARKRLYTLLDDVAQSHEAVQIAGNAIPPSLCPKKTGGPSRKHSI